MAFKILTDTLRKQFIDAGCTIAVEPWPPCGEPGEWEILRGPDGSYVCPTDAADVAYWLVKYGIFQPLARPGGAVACHGKATKGECAGKWVGWSHRAAAAFGIGDMQFNPSLLAGAPTDDRVPVEGDPYRKWGYTPFNQVGTEPITTDDEAKAAALCFADYIS